MILSWNIGIVSLFYLLTNETRPTITKFVFIHFWNSKWEWMFWKFNRENISLLGFFHASCYLIKNSPFLVKMNLRLIKPCLWRLLFSRFSLLLFLIIPFCNPKFQILMFVLFGIISWNHLLISFMPYGKPMVVPHRWSLSRLPDPRNLNTK